MKKGFVKNIAIFALTALALAQTFSLWFSSAAGQTLLSGVLDRFVSAPSGDETSLFVRPARIIEGGGDAGNAFFIQYNGLDESKVRSGCDAFIKSALRDGEYAGSKPADYKELLGRKSVIYDYAFNMPAGLFAEAFGQKNANIVSRCASVKSVHMYPGEAGQGSEIVFFDGSTAYAYRSRTALAIDGAVMSDLGYAASALAGNSVLGGNAFIPLFPKGAYAYPSVQVTNPYAAGDRLLYEIEKNVAGLFTNPAAIYSYSGWDKVFTYSDDTTVVKYFQNDVLEYASHKPEQGGVGRSVLNYFSNAVNFIKNDRQVTNEMYLAGYAENGRQIAYWFDYAINNLPVIIPNSYRGSGESSISHAIEVVVTDGRVTSYKKLVYNFALSYRDGGTATKSFDEFIAGIAGQNANGGPSQNEALKNADVALGFEIDQRMQASLYWVLSMDGSAYSVSAR